MRCPECQHENPIDAKFCNQCATPLSRPSPGGAERRQLTVMFCDVVESTALAGKLDPEDWRDVIRAYQNACAVVIHRFEGHIAQYLGDGILVYFGYPQAHEDDAQRAVRSGLALAEAIPGKALPGARPAVQVGIDTGIMIVTTGVANESPAGAGRASTLAVRLGALARPGAVVISEATMQLVAGYFDCKALEGAVHSGAPEAQLVYEVRGESALKTRLEVESAYGLTPFVGREAEVALLQERWTYVQEGMGQVVLLLGEPGMGKSRLLQGLREQVASELPEALECRCSPYHQNTALYPLIDLVQRAWQSQSVTSPEARLAWLEAWLTRYGIAPDETIPLLATLLSLPLPEGRYPPLALTPERQRERTLETLLSLLLVQASASPLLFVVEDVHWADPSMLDFLQLLTEHVAAAAMLVVLTCRPEFEPHWGSRTEITSVVLNRLTRGQMQDMILQVTANRTLPAAVVAQLIEKTDGVPLYVEELTRMVLESGQLVERDGRYELVGELTELTIPATLHDSLMARLDRLSTGKDIAQWGAVLGREFRSELLEAVAPYDEAFLQSGLAQLVEAGLLFQRGLFPQTGYRFKHALIQDAAYNALLKRRRQALHLQTAEVIEAQFPEMAEAQPELLAHHYTEAGRAEPAIPYWQRAGQRALAHSANQEAIRYLSKGLEVLQTLPDGAQRWGYELDLQVLLGPVLMVTKGLAAQDVQRVYIRAQELCQQLGDTPQLFPALWGLWRYYNSRPWLSKAREVSEQLLNLAESSQDSGLRMQAHLSRGVTLSYLGEFAPALDNLDRALARYDVSQPRNASQAYGDHDPETYCLVNQAHVLWRLGFPDRALAKSTQALTLARQLSHPHTITYALNFAGVVHGLRREADRVRGLMDEQLALSDEHGFALWRANGNIMQGWALTECGQAEAGLAQMEAGLAAHVATGAELALPFWSCMLAEAHRHGGHIAKGLAVLAEILATVERTGERQMVAESHRLKGELLLLQGTPDESQAAVCFQTALDIARHQQAKSLELRAAMSLARWWRRQGQPTQARALLTPVYAWFTEGFDTADLEDAKGLLG